MTKVNNFLSQVGFAVTVGSTIGLVVGACNGTINAFRLKIPGLLKIRYIARTTVGTAATVGLYMVAGTVVDPGKSY